MFTVADRTCRRNRIVRRRDRSEGLVMGGRVIRAASGAVPTAETFTSSLPPADGGSCRGVDTGLLRQNNHVHAWLIDHVNDDEAWPMRCHRTGLTDSDGHGTFVAGLILQRGAWTAVVEMVRALDTTTIPRELDRFIAGGDPHADRGTEFKVINLSFGGQTWESTPPPDIRDALESAGDPGVVVTAPAGNRPSGDRSGPLLLPTNSATSFRSVRWTRRRTISRAGYRRGHRSAIAVRG